MFERLPAGWGRKTEAERVAWLGNYFRDAAQLTGEEKLVSARCGNADPA
jgi:hypothetical protein